MTKKPETPTQALERILVEELGEDRARAILQRYAETRRAYARQRRVARARATLAYWRNAAEEAIAHNQPGRMWVVRRYEQLKKLVEDADKERRMDHDDLPDDAPGGDDPDTGPYADE